MANIFKYGFFVLIVVIILIVVFKGRSQGDKLYIDTLHEQIDGLNEKISHLDDENTRIATSLALKMDSISVLRSEVAQIENKRIAAIRYYEKRIRDIDNITVHGLDSLFAERYGLSGSNN